MKRFFTFISHKLWENYFYRVYTTRNSNPEPDPLSFADPAWNYPYALEVHIFIGDSIYLFAEIVRAMNYVINQGWAMYWGTSGWSAVEIMDAYSNCRQFNCVCPIVEQSEYHLFHRDKLELYMPELYNKIGEFSC